MTTKIWQDIKHRSKHPRTQKVQAKNRTVNVNQKKRNERALGITIALFKRYLDGANIRWNPQLPPPPDNGTCNAAGVCTDIYGNYCSIELLKEDGTCAKS